MGKVNSGRLERVRTEESIKVAGCGKREGGKKVAVCFDGAVNGTEEGRGLVLMKEEGIATGRRRGR